MLTQQQRIETSKKVVSIPKENETALTTKDLISTIELPKAMDVDNANKSIIDIRKPLIDGYQSELQMLDGNGRTRLVEQDYLNASNRTLGNFFFYNQLTVPTPSNPDGIWKNLQPFLLGYGVGKNYNEVFTPVQKEQDLIDAFNSAVNAFELLHPMERSTGQIPTTSPSVPPTTIIATYPAAQTGLANIVTAINNYLNFVTTQSGAILTSDFVLTRQVQSLSAKTYIDNTVVPAFNLWLSYNDFNTAHGQTTSAGFYAFNTALLAPTKGNPIQLDILKNVILDRKNFIDNTRIPQLNSYLGSVSQDLNNGEITSKSGLYGERASAIVMRLGVMGGSLSKIVGLESALKVQDAIVNTNQVALNGYELLIKVQKLKAPANNTSTVHVSNASVFSVGDSVFVCGDGQTELLGTVVSVSGTRIDLDFQVPQKYTPQNNSRIYKLT